MTVDEIAAALGGGLGVTVEPERPEQYRAGDIRHCFADRASRERSWVPCEGDARGWFEGSRRLARRPRRRRPGGSSDAGAGRARTCEVEDRLGTRCAPQMDDLAVIIVSTNEARWLRPCLSTLFAHLGALRADIVVADNRSTDGTRELVESEFAAARVVTCDNYGFGHANNRALLTTNARYVVFLNPDTEIREGSFEVLVARMDASRPARPRGRETDHAGRAPLSYDLPLSECPSRALPGHGLGAVSSPSIMARGARARSEPLRDRVRLRLDLRARSCSPGAKHSRAPVSSTSASSSTRRRRISAFGSRRPDGIFGTFRP